jgi:hypothetical protein
MCITERPGAKHTGPFAIQPTIEDTTMNQPNNAHVVNARIIITDEFCANVMSGALEGGIGYWCAAGNIKREPFLPLPGESFEYLSFDAYDAEDHNNQFGVVTYGTIRLGVERLLTGVVKTHYSVLGRLLADACGNAGAMDSCDYDVIVQAGLFNEVVFG